MPNTTNHAVNLPTVGADADAWGTENNDAHQAWDTLTSGAQNTVLGRVAASSGPMTQLTATQLTTIPNAVTADAGSGGLKGLVPAPGAGDTAAQKFLKANATWAVPKPWAFALINGSTGALVAGHNVTSTARAALGRYTMTMTSAASSVNYTVQATARLASASGFGLATVDENNPPTTTVVTVRTALITATPTVASGDVAYLYVTVWQ